MEAELYCNILKSTLIPFIQETLPNHRFMQDNDPKHTSRVAKAFFEEKRINWWRTPPESPDLNPIEDLWHELKYFLESKVKPTTKQELFDGIKKFWAKKITVEKCNKYIDHVLFDAIPDVIVARGGKEDSASGPVSLEEETGSEKAGKNQRWEQWGAGYIGSSLSVYILLSWFTNYD